MKKKIIIFFNGERGYQVLKNFYDRKSIICCILEKTKYLSKTKKIIKNVVLQKNVNEKKFINFIKKKKPDILIVAGFSQIFKTYLLKAAKTIINLHAGKIPEYRGGSPLNWQIINNEKYFGLSILRMDKGIDTGPIILEKKFLLKSSYNIKNLHKISNYQFPIMTNFVIKNLNKIIPKSQEGKISKYWPQRNDNDGKINFKNYSGQKISRYVRALQDPYPNAWCLNQNNQKIRIQEVLLSKKKINGPYGSIRILKDKIYLKCISKNLIIKKFNYENIKKNKLTDSEILK